MKRVDISYGGENGFNQAIELAAETLGDVKFIQEKKLICKNKMFSLITKNVSFFKLDILMKYQKIPVNIVSVLMKLLKLSRWVLLKH